MADQEHLDILRLGVEVWNEWRKENPKIRPDLTEADLHGANLIAADLGRAKLHRANFAVANLSRANLSRADLIEANLNRATLIAADLPGADLIEANLTTADLRGATITAANLSRANFIETNLSRANLYGADLTEANLTRASLTRASLTRANLRGATITEADLTEADLTEANLSRANLSRANLNRADLSKSLIGWTTLTNIELSSVVGLDTVRHDGPSSIGIDTIYESQGNIPEEFLKGAGVDDTFITYIRSLVGKPIEYYSCFISYSSKDEAFARRLHADLQSHNVRCWFAPEDLKWGERIHTGIDEAIRLHDKLLLILSRHSISSGWVEHEVKNALAKERKEKRTVLFPVRLDDAVFDSHLSWTTEIRHERNIGDFTRWKNHDDYQKTFNRLLRDLKAQAPRRL